LNNWRAVGYIFLGWGSVFLIWAFSIFFAAFFLTSVLPSFAQLLIALGASAMPFTISALCYVVGFVGYYAGKENAQVTVTVNKAPIIENKKPVKIQVKDKVDSWWSFAVGALATSGSLIVLLGAGFLDASDLLRGMFLPTFLSIVAGSLAGLIALFLIDKINES
jgi:hypothetical protein